MTTLISGSTGVNKITDGTIVNADINASAAIDGTKLTGLTEIDKWILTVNKTDSSVVSANLERAGTTWGFVSLKGTGMTQSSGIFSFPSTGYWMVTITCLMRRAANDNVGVFIDVTDDNSTWETQGVNTWASNKDAVGAGSATHSAVDIIKVENVSLDKVRFATKSVASGSYLDGTTDYENTSFTFIKLGAL